MRKVHRDQIVDFITYDEQRESIRPAAIAAKVPRRVHVGQHLTFLFENADTVRYQIQEMTRAERIVKEADIQHEIDTYNELLGDGGEIGCCLLIEIEEEARRDELLRRWVDLPHHLFAELEDGTRAPARFDERQIGRGRVSSVQYLKFDVKGRAPRALLSEHPDLTVRAELTSDQRAALQADLDDGD